MAPDTRVFIPSLYHEPRDSPETRWVEPNSPLSFPPRHAFRLGGCLYSLTLWPATVSIPLYVLPRSGINPQYRLHMSTKHARYRVHPDAKRILDPDRTIPPSLASHMGNMATYVKTFQEVATNM